MRAVKIVRRKALSLEERKAIRKKAKEVDDLRDSLMVTEDPILKRNKLTGEVAYYA